jgi:hypothetical protein
VTEERIRELRARCDKGDGLSPASGSECLDEIERLRADGPAWKGALEAVAFVATAIPMPVPPGQRWQPTTEALHREVAALVAERDQLRAQQAAVIRMAADIRADLDATARAVAADVVAENEHLRACLADCRAALAAKGT